MDAGALRLLWLMECAGVGPATLRRVIGHYKGTPPEEFFGREMAWYKREFDWREELAERFAAYSTKMPARLAQLQQIPITVVTPFSEHFPSRWKSLADVPPVATLWGACDALTNRLLTIICSTDNDDKSRPEIKWACEAAVQGGWRIVAGHNRPVYQWALLAAKRAEAPAVMVLDRGLLSAFDEDLQRDPVPAARIWGYAFDTKRSVAVSTFRLWDPWIGANARRRDDLVAALADVVIAVGIRPDGTMHRVCREALARGQMVLADAEAYELLAEYGAQRWEGCLPELPARIAPSGLPPSGPDGRRNG